MAEGWQIARLSISHASRTTSFPVEHNRDFEMAQFGQGKLRKRGQWKEAMVMIE
jgi:hypothetical protein